MRVLIAFVVVSLAASVEAQPRTVAVGAEVSSLSGPYADGQAASVRVTLPRRNGWLRVDASAEERFGDRALVYSAAAAQDLGSRWLIVGGAGSSTSGLAYPRLHADVGVGRKWGSRRQLLTTATVALQDARDVHRDLSAVGEVTLYGDGLVAQVGARATLSQPGDALGYGAHAAVTLGDPAARHAVVRLAAAHEAYLLVGPTPTDVGFRSGEASATWHQPVRGPWSATVSAGLYANPYYTRAGLRTGISRRF